MRIGEFERWISEGGLKIIEQYGREKITKSDIAKKLQISDCTLALWFKRFPDADEAYEKGKNHELIEIFRKSASQNISSETNICFNVVQMTTHYEISDLELEVLDEVIDYLYSSKYGKLNNISILECLYSTLLSEKQIFNKNKSEVSK